MLNGSRDAADALLNTGTTTDFFSAMLLRFGAAREIRHAVSERKLLVNFDIVRENALKTG